LRDGEELGFRKHVGVGGGGAEISQRAADSRDIVPSGQVLNVDFEEELLVEEILELFDSLHSGTVTSLSP
jgi:hypothetical protein